MDLDEPFIDLSATFTSWLTCSKNVLISPKIALADLRSSGAGRGVVALSDLGEGETVFEIPRTSALSLQNSELVEVAPEVSLLDPWLALILVLLYETRPSSPWKPYLDVLPRTFDTLMFWTPSELSELQASAVIHKIGKQEAEESFRERLWPIVQRHFEVFRDADFSLDSGAAGLVEAAHRMGSIIMSYSFDLETSHPSSSPPPSPSAPESPPDEEEEEERGYYKAMVPLADMLNADPALNNCRLYQTPTTLSMKTISPVPAGSELFNDYGLLPRSDLVRRYGYITDGCAGYDVVEVSATAFLAGFAIDEKERMERVDYLLDEGILDDAFDIATDMEVPREAVVTVNTFLLSNEGFARMKARGEVPKANKSEETVGVLVRVLENRLAEYASSVEADQALLEGGTVSGRKKMAVEVRLGEKKILKGALEKLRGLQGNSKRTGEEGRVGGERSGKRVRI